MRSLLLFLAVSQVLLVGCASTVESKSIATAQAIELANLRKLAVWKFSNDGEQDLENTDRIQAQLSAIRLGGQAYFDLLERDELEHLMDLRKMEDHDLEGFIESRSAEEMQQIFKSSEAVVYGRITNSSVVRSQIAIEYDDGVVNCLKVNAKFSFLPKFLSVHTAKILYSDEFTGSAEESYCPDDDPVVDADLLEVARERALHSFRRAVAPYQVTEDIPLLTYFCSGARLKNTFYELTSQLGEGGAVCDDSSPSKEVESLVTSGQKFATKGRMDRACPMWEEAAAKHSTGFTMPYLIGVCAEVQDNDLEQARFHYKLADEQTMEPIEVISNALVRVDRKINNQNTLGHVGGMRSKASTEWRDAQRVLKSIGLYVGEVDGIAGTQSTEALTEFQRRKGLTPTGNLDEATQRVLAGNTNQ